MLEEGLSSERFKEKKMEKSKWQSGELLQVPPEPPHYGRKNVLPLKWVNLLIFLSLRDTSRYPNLNILKIITIENENI